MSAPDEPAPSPALPPGYRDEGPLASGGSGEVRAVCAPDGRRAVVKIAHAAGPVEAWAFEAEHRKLLRLAGLAGLPEALGVGRLPDGRPFLAMTRAPGQPLAPGLDPAGVLGAAAVRLAELHAAGWVHADVKRENMLYEPATGAVALLDAGLARPSGTVPATLDGTPLAMAPEVWRRAAAAPAQDVYALGVLAFELVTGAAPYAGAAAGGTPGAPPAAGTPGDLARQHLTAPVPSLAGPLGPLVRRMLAKAPGDRPSAAEVATALGRPVPPAAEQGLAPEPFLEPAGTLALWQLALTEAGSPPVLAVAGGPGSGKTRLLDALRAATLAHGGLWAGVRGFAGDAPGGAARALLAALAAGAADVPEALAAWLAGRPPAGLELSEPASQRAAALSGAVALLGGLAGGAPGCLAIGLDDADALDPLSAEWLGLLRRHPDLRAVRWAVTVGAADAAAEAAFGTLVPLAPWGAAEVQAYLATRLGAAPDPALAAFVLARTGGVAGAVARALEGVTAAGALVRAAAGWGFDAALAAAALPAGASDAYVAMLRAPIDQRGDAARRLARALAAGGAAGTPLPLAAAIAGLPAAEAGAIADALAADRLVVTLPGGRLALGAAALAEALWAEQAPAERAAAAAAWLAAIAGEPGEETGRTDPSPAPAGHPLPAGERTSDDRPSGAGGPAALPGHAAGLDDATRAHVVRIGWATDQPPARLWAHAIAAARAALGAGAPAAAADFLGPHAAWADAPAALRLAAEGLRGEACRHGDRLPEAERAYAAVLAAGGEVPPADRARALNGLARIQLNATRYDEASAACDEALGAGAPEQRLRALLCLARIRVYQGRGAEADACAQTAEREALALGRPALAAQALDLRGAQLAQTDPEAGAALLAEATRLARAAGDRLGEGYALEDLGNVELARGRPDLACEAFAAFVAIARQAGSETDALSGQLNELVAELDRGEARRVLRRAGPLRREAERLGRRFVAAIAIALEAAAGAALGRPEALPLADEALAAALALGSAYAEEVVRGYRLVAYAALGRAEAGLNEHARVVALTEASGHADARQRADAARASLLRAADDLLAARDAAQPLLDAASAVIRRLARVEVARLDELAGRPHEAFVGYAQARDVALTWQSPTLVAEAAALAARAAYAAWRQAAGPRAAAGGEPAVAGSGPAAASGLAAAGTPPAPESGLAAAGTPPAPESGLAAAGTPPAPESGLAAAGTPPAPESGLAAAGSGPAPAAPNAGLLAAPAATAEALAREAAAGPHPLAARLGAGVLAALGLAADGPAGDDGLDDVLPAFPALAAYWAPPASGRLAAPRPDRLTAAIAALLDAPDEAAIAEALLDAVIALGRMDRGYFLVFRGGRLELAISAGLDYAAGEYGAYSRTIADAAMMEGDAIYLVDAQADQRFADRASVMALDLRTVLAIPVASRERLIGVVYADRSVPDPILGPADLTALETLARLAGQRLDQARALVAGAREAIQWRRIAGTLAAGAAPQALLNAACAAVDADRGLLLGRADDASWQPAAAQPDAAGGLPAWTAAEADTVADAGLHAVPGLVERFGVRLGAWVAVTERDRAADAEDPDGPARRLAELAIAAAAEVPLI